MAVPRNRHSNSRKGMKCAQLALKAKTLHLCPNCSSHKQPHRACLSCGTYRGREVRRVAATEE